MVLKPAPSVDKAQRVHVSQMFSGANGMCASRRICVGLAALAMTASPHCYPRDPVQWRGCEVVPFKSRQVELTNSIKADLARSLTEIGPIQDLGFFEIEATVDGKGTQTEQSQNVEIASKRVMSVKEIYVRLGVPEKRIFWAVKAVRPEVVSSERTFLPDGRRVDQYEILENDIVIVSYGGSCSRSAIKRCREIDTLCQSRLKRHTKRVNLR